MPHVNIKLVVGTCTDGDGPHGGDVATKHFADALPWMHFSLPVRAPCPSLRSSDARLRSNGPITSGFSCSPGSDTSARNAQRPRRSKSKERQRGKGAASQQKKESSDRSKTGIALIWAGRRLGLAFAGRQGPSPEGGTAIGSYCNSIHGVEWRCVEFLISRHADGFRPAR